MRGPGEIISPGLKFLPILLFSVPCRKQLGCLDPFFDFVLAGCAAGQGFGCVEGGELFAQCGGVGVGELFGFAAAEHFEHVGID